MHFIRYTMLTTMVISDFPYIPGKYTMSSGMFHKTLYLSFGEM